MKAAPYTVPFEAQAYQSYLAGIKNWWRTDVYREVLAQSAEVDASDCPSLEQQMRKSSAYQFYAWHERVAQQFKFSGRWGMSTTLQPQRAALVPLIESAHQHAPERLQLDPELTVPSYVTGFDVHQLPGGLWRDPLNAWVLAWFHTGLTFAGGNPDALVDWYAKALLDRATQAGVQPLRVLDLGCTSGRSTRAIKRAMPEAEVIGCDVCEPVLRHGHLRALEEQCEITLCQQNAEALKFADQRFDLVASHWLFHELPPDAIRNVIREAARVLRPGGVFAIYDMCTVPGGVVGQWFHAGFAERNNEPYALPLASLDLHAELIAAGFERPRTDLTGPEYRGPEPEALPKARYMYMSMVSGIRAGQACAS